MARPGIAKEGMVQARHCQLRCHRACPRHHVVHFYSSWQWQAHVTLSVIL